MTNLKNLLAYETESLDCMGRTPNFTSLDMLYVYRQNAHQQNFGAHYPLRFVEESFKNSFHGNTDMPTFR